MQKLASAMWSRALAGQAWRSAVAGHTLRCQHGPAAVSSAWPRSMGSCAPPLSEEQKASTKDLNTKLEEAASQKGAAGVVQVVDESGEKFTESNVTHAIHSFASSIKSGDDVASLSKKPGFQVLIGMRVVGVWGGWWR